MKVLVYDTMLKHSSLIPISGLKYLLSKIRYQVFFILNPMLSNDLQIAIRQFVQILGR